MTSKGDDRGAESTLTVDHIKAFREAKKMIKISVNKLDAEGKLVGKMTPLGIYLDVSVCDAPFSDSDVTVFVPFHEDMKKALDGLACVMTSIVANTVGK